MSAELFWFLLGLFIGLAGSNLMLQVAYRLGIVKYCEKQKD
jgi:hypothetical protein